jgi:predicted Zn-dependent peptidase
MRTLPVLAAALLVFLAAPLNAQETAPPIEFETITLKNGLTIIVHEDNSTPIVAVTVWYDVGSAHEEEGRSGFAHLFEHMLSQETENLEQGELRRLVAGAGGTRNATTNNDRTAYYEILPSNRLNLALWLHAERLGRLQVTKENFEREREVVKEERRLRIENQPYSGGVETLDTLVADWPPYNHTVIGSMDDLNAAKTEDVRAFYEKYYVPNRDDGRRRRCDRRPGARDGGGVPWRHPAWLGSATATRIHSDPAQRRRTTNNGRGPSGERAGLHRRLQHSAHQR